MIIDILVELLYIIVVALIWVMLVYQVVLTASGYLYSRRKLKGSAIPDDQLPPLTIIIPARNEERVIAETVACMFRLDYPHDKLEVIIINDGSTDRTGAILAAVNDPRLKVITIPLAESGQGKSRVLNIAIQRQQPADRARESHVTGVPAHRFVETDRRDQPGQRFG